MNKIIFQIGLLAFCVCVVLFGTQMSSLLDAIVRSFLVFIGVILLALMVVGVSALFSSHERTAQEDETFRHRTDRQQPLTPASTHAKT